MPGGLWQGWIEFVPVGGGDPLARLARPRSPTARTPSIGQRASHRCIWKARCSERFARRDERRRDHGSAAFFDGPAALDDLPRAGGASVLNPFSLYRKGESLLRRQLGALSSWHLVNIIDTHGLSEENLRVLNALPPASLIEVIVDGVRRVNRVER